MSLRETAKIMNGVLQAFITAVTVAVLSAIAITILKRFVPKDPTPTENTEAISYSQTKLIRFASFFVMIAWTGFLMFWPAVALVAFHVLKNPIVIVWVLLMLVGGGFLYASTAIFLKCDKCRRRMLFQWSNQIIPPFSEKIFGMTGWSATVLNVAVHKKFRCMYCGQKYNLQKK